MTKAEAIFHTDRVCSQQLIQQNKSVVGGVVGGTVGGGLGAIAGSALFGNGFGSLVGGLVGTGVGASVGAGGRDTTEEVCEEVRVIKRSDIMVSQEYCIWKEDGKRYECFMDRGNILLIDVKVGWICSEDICRRGGFPIKCLNRKMWCVDTTEVEILSKRIYLGGE